MTPFPLGKRGKEIKKLNVAFISYSSKIKGDLNNINKEFIKSLINVQSSLEEGKYEFQVHFFFYP